MRAATVTFEFTMSPTSEEARAIGLGTAGDEANPVPGCVAAQIVQIVLGIVAAIRGVQQR